METKASAEVGDVAELLNCSPQKVARVTLELASGESVVVTGRGTVALHSTKVPEGDTDRLSDLRYVSLQMVVD